MSIVTAVCKNLSISREIKQQGAASAIKLKALPQTEWVKIFQNSKD